MAESHNKHVTPLTAGGILISLGIIYGDIGTSPIYTFGFIVDNHKITEDLILGGLSCVFWTLTLITTINVAQPMIAGKITQPALYRLTKA